MKNARLKMLVNEYGASHINPINKLIHKFCVPLIAFSLLGLLWVIPFPFTQYSWINWATLFLAGCAVFYVRFGFKIFTLVMSQALLLIVLVSLLAQTETLFMTSIFIFILAWIAQLVGHKIEGKKPSFLKDLQFLLIGPLWVTYPLFKKLYN